MPHVSAGPQIPSWQVLRSMGAASQGGRAIGMLCMLHAHGASAGPNTRT